MRVKQRKPALKARTAAQPRVEAAQRSQPWVRGGDEKAL